MNSRAYQFQLQAAEAAAAAAAAAPVLDAEGDEPEVTPKALLLKIQAQGTADDPASRQGSGGLAPTMGTILGNAEATKCPECPKWFASEKAMFGHLRKHPERGYKGATRPTASAAAAAAVAGDKKPTKKVPRKETGVPAINMVAVEKKPWGEAEELSTKWWPATAKRGRTPVALVQASSCSEEEEAAMILLELASSSRTSSETQQQPSVEPARATDAVSGHQIQTSDVEEPMLLDHPAAHQTPDPEAERQIVQPENALELSAESQTPAAKQVTDLVITTEAVLIVVPANKPVFPSLDSGAGDKKAKKQRRVVTNPEQTAASTSPPPPPEGAVVRTPPTRRIPSPASNKKHTCPTCGKSFPTHQALGGHMSSHVKGKTTSARHDDLAAAQAMHNILAHRHQSAGNGNVIVPASAGAAALQERQDAQPPPAQAQAPAPHVCDECHLIFPSGQALGGHKRKHWFPEKQQAKAAAPAPAPAPRDFDLNEMPEEGQGENNSQP